MLHICAVVSMSVFCLRREMLKMFQTKRSSSLQRSFSINMYRERVREMGGRAHLVWAHISAAVGAHVLSHYSSKFEENVFIEMEKRACSGSSTIAHETEDTIYVIVYKCVCRYYCV